MQRDSDRQGEEDAWRAIVENYGDRVQLDDDDPTDFAADLGPEGRAPDLGPGLFDAAPRGLSADLFAGLTGAARELPASSDEADENDEDREDGRFVPPVPPPLPSVPHDRMFAWIGLFGSPAVLLLCVVIGFHLPALVAYLLVAAFVGGFVYLVVKMPRGPVDPWDDGARL